MKTVKIKSLSKHIKDSILNFEGYININDLPHNVMDYCELKAKQLCNSKSLVSSEEILAKWGTAEKFHEWKSEQIKIAEQLNLEYLAGKIKGVILSWVQYMQDNELEIDSSELNIDVYDLAKEMINDAQRSE